MLLTVYFTFLLLFNPAQGFFLFKSTRERQYTASICLDKLAEGPSKTFNARGFLSFIRREAQVTFAQNTKVRITASKTREISTTSFATAAPSIITNKKHRELSAVPSTTVTSSHASSEAATTRSQSTSSTPRESQQSTSLSSKPPSSTSAKPTSSQTVVSSSRPVSASSSTKISSSTPTRSSVAVSITSQPSTTTFLATSTPLSNDKCGTTIQIKIVTPDPISPSAPPPTRTPVPNCLKVPPSGNVDIVNVCSSPRWCDPGPPNQAKITFMGLDGFLQRQEVETTLSLMQSTPVYLLNGYGNGISDGSIGWTADGAARVFEATGDIRFLDLTLRLAENMLWARNDPVTGRIMWDGIREPVWPPKDANGLSAGYSGAGDGHITGHMVDAANIILKSPCLWNKQPQNSSSPSILPANATYLQRAVSLVQGADQTMDSYILRWFLDSQLRLIQPNDPRWNSLGDLMAGSPMPWNRRSMMFHGILKLATAHAIPGTPVFNKTRAVYLDSIVNANIIDFRNHMKPAVSPIDGSPTFTWSYTAQVGGIEANNGIHAFYDFWGLWTAWQHGSAPNILNDTLMYTMANMMQNAMWSNTTKCFSGELNGISNTCSMETSPTYWMRFSVANYARWIPEWYYTLGNQDLAMGVTNRVYVYAPLLWAKTAMRLNTDSFWIGAYSRAT